ncbi:aminoglycoside adenylyltransferase domain-containing protein [Streptomyces fragilis]|uniref:Aminoglycoside adenylyltransferase domain-containing protein n=1 Tax=Streptomyces fragilis TaxID=67301 RepID=A0ABV2YK11_9ACTN|nr:aminoglycoside adenylyltransferase domain-containing protein [Streptomyces fragilis]
MDQTREVVRLAEAVLGDDLVGAYLHGSAVLGGWRPASDVDVLLVTRGGMDEGRQRALLAGLLPVSGSRHGLRPLEVTVVVRSQLRPWRYAPEGDFLYGEWLRDTYEAGLVPRPQRMPDLALTVGMVLAGDRPLAGPAPARVLDEVPYADVVRACLEGVPGLLDGVEEDTRNVLLTLARVWYTLATGRVGRKDAAADWVLRRLPPALRPVLGHARHLYLHCGYDEETWDAELRARVPALVAYVLAGIESTGAGGAGTTEGTRR